MAITLFLTANTLAFQGSSNCLKFSGAHGAAWQEVQQGDA
jgi:hypothetical protein